MRHIYVEGENMSRQKVKVKIFGSNELSEEERRVIWRIFFNIFEKKKMKEESSENKKVGSEEIIKN